MIIRNVAIRHGRTALAAPIQKSCLRALTTETTTQDPQSAIQPPPQPSHLFGRLRRGIARPSDFSHNIPRHTNTPPDPKSSRTNARIVKAKLSLKQHLNRRTRTLGSSLEPYYEPDSVLIDPPRPEDVTLELLMASQSHLGHATSLWNPMNQRYIYGVRQGIHIISLEETAAHLRRAARVVEGVAYHGGLLLFVGTRKRQAACVVKAAELAMGCHLFDRWKPGAITNGDQILGNCAIKAVDKDDNEVDGFEQKVDEWKALKPDLVVVLNPLENKILLHECMLNNIPTIGVVDTDCDPTLITYPIPANDDSLRCIQVIAGVLGRAGEEGQRRRLEAAAKGKITWHPPEHLGKPFEDEQKKKNKTKEEVVALEAEKERERAARLGDDGSDDL